MVDMHFELAILTFHFASLFRSVAFAMATANVQVPLTNVAEIFLRK